MKRAHPLTVVCSIGDDTSRRLAFGGYWNLGPAQQGETDPAATTRAEAMRDARRGADRASHIAVHMGHETQYYLAWARRRGSKAEAAAAIVLDNREDTDQSLLAAYEVPGEGWWVIAITQHTILAGRGDTMFRTADEPLALRYFLELYNERTFERVQAPAQWLEGDRPALPVLEEEAMAGLVEISDLLAAVHGHHGPLLEPAGGLIATYWEHPRRNHVLIAAGVALVLLGIFEYFQRLEDEEVAAEVARQAALKNRPADTLPRPWNDAPMPSDSIHRCLDMMGTATLYPPGWDLSATSCTNGVVTVIWERKGGTMDTVEDVVRGVGLDGPISFRKQGDEAVLTQTWQIPLAPRPPQDLLPSLVIQQAMWTIKQLAQIGEEKSGVTTANLVLPDGSVGATREAVLLGTDWSLTVTDNDPAALAPALDKIPGLTVPTIIFTAPGDRTGSAAADSGGAKWSFQGKIYYADFFKLPSAPKTPS